MDAAIVRSLLNLQEVHGHSIYLGLPTFSMRQKRVQFGYIHEKVQRKLMGWQNKFLSAGGKEITLKSVIQAIPTYTMACFRQPDSICRDINRMGARFWWGDEENHRRMHWTKWEELCKPKERGGLGFRNLKSFNKAMLAKQIWRMIQYPSSLVSKVFKARYFRDCDILEATIKPSASFVWRSLAWSRTLIKKGVCWRVGDGRSIRAFHDAWIPNSPSGVLTRETENMGEIRVAELINSSNQWDHQSLALVCWPFEMEIVLALPLGSNGADKRYWKHEQHGKYTVKSGYLTDIGYYEQANHSSTTDKKFWSRLVWRLKVPPKVSVFDWRAYRDIIPTEINLLDHHVPTKGICTLCGMQNATTMHCLFFCIKISKFWKESLYWNILRRGKHLRFLEMGELMCQEMDTKRYEIWIILVWMAWKFSCDLKHGGKKAMHYLDEEQGVILWQTYQEARKVEMGSTHLGVQTGDRIWKNPVNGLRVDVDAMFNPSINKFGVGAIVRDSNKRIIAAMARPLPSTATVMEAEILAALYGMRLSLEERIRPISIHTDSLLTVRCMANNEVDVEFLLDDLQEIMELFKKGSTLEIIHAYRSANRATHSLAQFAGLISNEMVWKNTYPIWLLNIVNLD